MGFPPDLTGPVEEVAPRLLGVVVHAGGVAVRLTEVEAYGDATDAGSHARSGPAGRAGPMYGPPGTAYVYFTYGMHWCANLVTGPPGVAAAVLLRAGEVVAGLERATERRRGAPPRELARGPARLARCLGLSGEDNGRLLVLSAGPEDPEALAARVATGPRVGVAGPAALRPWRFWLEGEETVSPYRPASRRRGATPAAPPSPGAGGSARE